MVPIRNIVIEGCDRLGKDTLIIGVMNKLGFFQKLHYQKPELLDLYLSETSPLQSEANRKSQALKRYQNASFTSMFQMLGYPGAGNFILNRAHLGEAVYSQRYRGYDGSYVFDLENEVGKKCLNETLLVLLHTSDFKFIQDDGLSFDFDKKEEEQNDFIRAFERSNITYKLMVDVCDGAGNFVPTDRILNTVVSAYQQIQSMNYPVWNVNWTVEGENESKIYEQHNYLQPDPKKSMS